MKVELVVLAVVSMIGAVHFLSVNWFTAVLITPFVVTSILLSIVVLVQLLWLSVVGLERAGTACGFRKTPLS